MVARSPKPKLSEMRAAELVMETVFTRATAEWPRIYDRFREAFGDRFTVDGDRAAIFDLGLAALALDAQALPNLFPTDQAKCLTAWLEEVVNSPEYGEYAVSELREYGRVFQEGAAPETGNPLGGLDALAIRLLRSWLDDRLALFDAELDGRKTGMIEPFLIMLTEDILKPFVGKWRSVRDEFELEPEDLPIGYRDWEAFGIYEPGKYPHLKRPDGTLIFHGEDGKPVERWFPLRFLNKLFSSGRARRVGTNCAVLVKGPWEGAKETSLCLSDEDVAKYLGDDGYAYGLCKFKGGKPEYSLIHKHAWEHFEELQAVLQDASLSESERKIRVERVLAG